MWVLLLRTCAPKSAAGSRRWCRTWSLGMRAQTAAWHMRWVLLRRAVVGPASPSSSPDMTFPLTLITAWSCLAAFLPCVYPDLVCIVTFSTSSACLLTFTFAPSLTFSHSARVKLFMCHHPSNPPLTALNVYPRCPRHCLVYARCLHQQIKSWVGTFGQTEGVKPFLVPSTHSQMCAACCVFFPDVLILVLAFSWRVNRASGWGWIEHFLRRELVIYPSTNCCCATNSLSLSLIRKWLVSKWHTIHHSFKGQSENRKCRWDLLVWSRWAASLYILCRCKLI